MKLLAFTLTLLFLVAVGYWYFLHPRVLSQPIASISIVTQKGDTIPEAIDDDTYRVTSLEEIDHLKQLIGKVPRIPLHKDLNPNELWIINIYDTHNRLTFIIVDQYSVAGKKRKNSPIYQYLKKNYSRKTQ